MKFDAITLSVLGLAIDLVVSMFFAFRLFRARQKAPKNNLVRYFLYYFSAFSVFLALTFFYQPNFLVKNDDILKICFAVAIGVLLYISTLVYRINFEIFDIKRKTQRLIMSAWSILGILLWVLLFYRLRVFSGSEFYTELSKLLWAAPLIGTIIGIPFIVAAFTFIKKGLQESTSKKKYILLGLSFALVILGGPLHSASIYSVYYIVGDILTTAGFIAAFAAIISEQD